jgi:hypothetical protein
MIEKERKDLISRLLRAIGTERGIRAKLAKACGTTPQAVTGWLQRGKIDRVHFPEIARITGYNLAWLMTGEGVARPDDEAPEYLNSGLNDVAAEKAADSSTIGDKFAVYMQLGKVIEDFTPAELSELFEQVAIIRRRKSGGF